MRGVYSETDYQLDGLIIGEEDKSMIEVKDYSFDDRKVGRGDLQKMQGALSDLDIKDDIFASATDYTKPAIKYAKSSESNPNHKKIELYNIRPSTELDEKGRIKKIVVNMHYSIPNMEVGHYSCDFTEEAKKKFVDNGFVGKEIAFNVDRFFDKNGDFKITMLDFTSKNQPNLKSFEDEFAEDFWNLDGYFIKYDDKFYGLNKLNYKIPYVKGSEEFTIEIDGNACVLIKSIDGKINKLLTDEQFKSVTIENKEINIL